MMNNNNVTMLTDEDIMDTVPFIYDIFNYYNGRINRFPVYKFYVSMIKTPSRTFAYTTSPGIITIQPFTFKYLIHSDMEYLRYYIVSSIVHELYHIDQDIRYDVVYVDYKYRDIIEANVEFLTSTYLLSHSNEIYNVFGIDVTKYEDISHIKAAMRKPVLYRRKDTNTHIINCILSLCGAKILENNGVDTSIIYDFTNSLFDYNVITVLGINDAQMIIDSDTNINEFNDFAYNNGFKYSNTIIGVKGGFIGEVDGMSVKKLQLSITGNAILASKARSREDFIPIR